MVSSVRVKKMESLDIKIGVRLEQSTRWKGSCVDRLTATSNQKGGSEEQLGSFSDQRSLDELRWPRSAPATTHPTTELTTPISNVPYPGTLIGPVTTDEDKASNHLIAFY